MAKTATKRRKAAKRIQTGAATAGSNGSASIASAPADKFAPNQKPLDTMEDVDERIPALEEACQRVLADREKKNSLGESVREGLGEIGKLLKEHERECYIVAGKKFVPVAGQPTVKIFKVKQQ